MTSKELKTRWHVLAEILHPINRTRGISASGACQLFTDASSCPSQVSGSDREVLSALGHIPYDNPHDLNAYNLREYIRGIGGIGLFALVVSCLGVIWFISPQGHSSSISAATMPPAESPAAKVTTQQLSSTKSAENSDDQNQYYYIYQPDTSRFSELNQWSGNRQITDSKLTCLDFQAQLTSDQQRALDALSPSNNSRICLANCVNINNQATVFFKKIPCSTN